MRTKLLNSAGHMLLLLVLTLIAVSGFAQNKAFDEAACQKAVLAQAAQMGEAYVKNDGKTFCRFMHPDIAQMAGGQQRMTIELQKGMDEMQAAGTKVVRVVCGSPSKIVVSGIELQCTLLQSTEMRQAGQTRKSSSALIAISRDKGANWYFLDTAGKDLATVRASFPSISSELVLPNQE